MTNVERLESIIQDSIVMRDGVPLPSIIEISLIDSCNRACTFCPRSNPEIAPNNPNEISWGLLQRIKSDMLGMGFRGLLTFSGFCEPFMHSRLFDAVELFSRDFRVDVITNGDYLTKAKVIRLMNSGLNRLLVSVYDEPRLAPIQEMVAGYEDRTDIRIRFNGFKTTNRAGTLADAESNLPCYYLAYHMILDWNGDVVMCPQDWNRRVRFGNVAQTPLFDIWKSKHMTRWRKELFKGRTSLPCSKCDAQGTVHGATHRDLWKS